MTKFPAAKADRGFSLCAEITPNIERFLSKRNQESFLNSGVRSLMWFSSVTYWRRGHINHLTESLCMSEMQIFEKAEFGKVRVVERDGQPWFVARDVAKMLGYDKVCFEKHISDLSSEFKETLGLDLYEYNTEDLNALMYQDSSLYISNFGLQLIFEYLYDHDRNHLETLVKSIDIGYVYVINDIDNNKRKIGKTNSPSRRILNVCSAAGVKNKKVFLSNRVINHSFLENEMKRRFQNTNIHGEWFKASFNEIVEQLKQKEVIASPVLEILEKVFMDNSSADFLEHAKQFLRWK